MAERNPVLALIGRDAMPARAWAGREQRIPLSRPPHAKFMAEF